MLRSSRRAPHRVHIGDIKFRHVPNLESIREDANGESAWEFLEKLQAQKDRRTAESDVTAATEWMKAQESPGKRTPDDFTRLFCALVNAIWAERWRWARDVYVKQWSKTLKERSRPSNHKLYPEDKSSHSVLKTVVKKNRKGRLQQWWDKWGRSLQKNSRDEFARGVLRARQEWAMVLRVFTQGSKDFAKTEVPWKSLSGEPRMLFVKDLVRKNLEEVSIEQIFSPNSKEPVVVPIPAVISALRPLAPAKEIQALREEHKGRWAWKLFRSLHQKVPRKQKNSAPSSWVEWRERMFKDFPELLAHKGSGGRNTALPELTFERWKIKKGFSKFADKCLEFNPAQRWSSQMKKEVKTEKA
jgi:hypothetical protein